jgi:dipeptidyl aminopeptidase/acylaminoacyl peptidase
VRRIDDIAPWRVFSGLDAGRRGDHPVVVGARNGDEFGLVVLDESGTVAQLAAGGRGEHDLVCPSWNDGGDQILAMRNTSDIDERRLQLIDLTGERTSRPLDLPFTVVGCSAFITDDRLVVADAALTIDGPRGMWTVGVDGSDPRQVYSREDCTTQVGSVDPTATRVAVSQRCPDPTASGLWVVDLSSGEADQVVNGNTGPPKWSPDGTWLVFGLRPFFGHPMSTVWMARADGRQLRQVTEEPAWTPVWLPPP